MQNRFIYEGQQNKAYWLVYDLARSTMQGDIPDYYIMCECEFEDDARLIAATLEVAHAGNICIPVDRFHRGALRLDLPPNNKDKS